MSERLSNKEVEDVLSSVRRLVSKQAGSASADHEVEPDAPAPASVDLTDDDEADVADEKLLLTPAFRVEEQQDAPEPEAEAEPDPEPEPEIQTMSSDDAALTTPSPATTGSVWSLEERIAELEAAVGGHVDEWEPDGSEDVAAEAPTEFPIAPAQETVADLDEAQDTSGDEQQSLNDGNADDRFDVAHESTDASEGHEADADVATDEPAYVDMPGSNIVFAHQSAAEPTAPETDAVADTADAADGEGAGAIELDDLTEEMLRDLVADIVRDELQGALGERITRNVRKLVRREIQRALATGRIE